LEEECTGEFRSRKFEIQNSRRVLSRFEKRVWRRRKRSSKSDRIKETRVRRKDNGEICLGVSEGRKRK